MYLIKYHALKKYRKWKYISSFLNHNTRWEWSASHLGRCISGKRPLYPLNMNETGWIPDLISLDLRRLRILKKVTSETKATFIITMQKLLVSIWKIVYQFAWRNTLIVSLVRTRSEQLLIATVLVTEHELN